MTAKLLMVTVSSSPSTQWHAEWCNLFSQTRSKVKGKLRCKRPGCERAFTTSSGRTRHLQTFEPCKSWLEVYFYRNKHARQIASSSSSSEVGSDEGCSYPRENCVDDTQMDVDLELGKPVWGGTGGEETEYITPEDADFTSSPMGVDLQSADPIDSSEPTITVEEYPRAAEVIEVRKNRCVQLWESDKLYELRKIAGAYYPFSGKVEWQAVDKVLQHLPMGKVDDFLKLEYVRLTIVLLLLAWPTVLLDRSDNVPFPSHLHESCERVSRFFLVPLPGRR